MLTQGEPYCCVVGCVQWDRVSVYIRMRTTNANSGKLVVIIVLLLLLLLVLVVLDENITFCSLSFPLPFPPNGFNPSLHLSLQCYTLTNTTQHFKCIQSTSVTFKVFLSCCFECSHANTHTLAILSIPVVFNERYRGYPIGGYY